MVLGWYSVIHCDETSVALHQVNGLWLTSSLSYAEYMSLSYTKYRNSFMLRCTRFYNTENEFKLNLGNNVTELPRIPQHPGNRSFLIAHTEFWGIRSYRCSKKCKVDYNNPRQHISPYLGFLYIWITSVDEEGRIRLKLSLHLEISKQTSAHYSAPLPANHFFGTTLLCTRLSSKCPPKHWLHCAWVYTPNISVRWIQWAANDWQHVRTYKKCSGCYWVEELVEKSKSKDSIAPLHW